MRVKGDEGRTRGSLESGGGGEKQYGRRRVLVG